MAKTPHGGPASPEINNTNQYPHTQALPEAQPPVTGFDSNPWWLAKIAKNPSIGMDMYFSLLIAWI